LIEEPGSIAPQVILETTCVSALSLYISTSRICSGGGGGGGEEGGDSGNDCGNIGWDNGITGEDGCTTIPEELNLSVDWIIPTAEKLPINNRDMTKIEANMKDLLCDVVPLINVGKNNTP
jgi:hypothetical protein